MGMITISQAREFHKHTNFDASILTKTDADSRGGAALSIVAVTSTPVMYIGLGQEYGDLAPFEKNTFLNSVFEISPGKTNPSWKFQKHLKHLKHFLKHLKHLKQKM